jgi:hypothetical protein
MVASIQKSYFNKVKLKGTTDSACNYGRISGIKTAVTSKSLPQYLIEHSNSHSDRTYWYDYEVRGRNLAKE